MLGDQVGFQTGAALCVDGLDDTTALHVLRACRGERVPLGERRVVDHPFVEPEEPEPCCRVECAGMAQLGARSERGVNLTIWSDMGIVPFDGIDSSFLVEADRDFPAGAVARWSDGDGVIETPVPAGDDDVMLEIPGPVRPIAVRIVGPQLLSNALCVSYGPPPQP